jgi:hypothetical protein
MTTLEILQGARKLIATPETWTIGIGARDKYGEKTGFDEKNACRWCLWGALCRAAGRMLSDDDASLFNALGFEFGTDVFDWNDAPDRNHAEVLARLDEAIAKAST